MSPENFAFWLQGYFEVLAAGDDPEAELTPQQVACIKDHLALVFDKHTPTRTGGSGSDRRKKEKKSRVVTVRSDGLDPFSPDDLICKTDEKPIAWVAPPVNSNQVRLDIEAEVKKSIKRAHPPKPKTGVEFWAGLEDRVRSDSCERPVYTTSCKWTGGGFGQKYC